MPYCIVCRYSRRARGKRVIIGRAKRASEYGFDLQMVRRARQRWAIVRTRVRGHAFVHGVNGCCTFVLYARALFFRRTFYRC